MDLSLDRIDTFLRTLDRPQDAFHSIHVTGTNGKGSICAYLTSIFTQVPNVRIGTFTSPHFLTPRDSIRINDEPISQAEFDDVRHFVQLMEKNTGISLTLFERQVATMFMAFKQNEVDLAIIEVGMGGKRDATNVLSADKVICSVISRIDLDHQLMLGNTVKDIAKEKCGIIKENSRVVSAKQHHSDAQSVIASEVSQLGAHLSIGTHEGCRVNSDGLTYSGHLTEMGSSTPVSLNPQLIGRHQLDNAAVAAQVAHTVYDLVRENTNSTNQQPTNNSSIYEKLKTLSSLNIQDGIAQARWPGRCEWIECSEDVQFLLDGAHNPDGAHALRGVIDTISTKARENGCDELAVQFVYGAGAGRNIMEVLRILVKPGDRLIAVPFTQPEEMPWVNSYSAEEIASQVNASAAEPRTGAAAEACSDLGQVFTKFANEASNGTKYVGPSTLAYEQHARKQTLIVICGSLYLAADFYRQLERAPFK